MARNMHSYIQTVLDHPMFTDETRKVMLLLVSGIRNQEWLKDTFVFGTPEKGCKIISGNRDLLSTQGYYEIYVHDYYVDIFIKPADSSRMAPMNESDSFTEYNWDMEFRWDYINLLLSGVNGVHSWH